MTSPNGEAESVLKLHRDKISENETWAVIDAKWLQVWCQYSGADFDTKKVGESKGPRPGPINNSALAVEGNPFALRMGLLEKTDYDLVYIDVWNHLVQLYSLSAGSNAYLRGVLVKGIRKTKRVDLYPIFLNLANVGDNGEPADSKADQTKPFERTLSYLQLATDFSSEGRPASDPPLDEKALSVRLWRETARPPPRDEEDKKDAKKVQEPEPKVDENPWTLIANDELRAPLELVVPKDGAPLRILIERKKADGSWPRKIEVREWNDFREKDIVDGKDTVGKWYETTIVRVEEKRVFIHFNGWPSNWDEWVDRDSPRLAPRNKHTSSGGRDVSSFYGGNEEGAPPVIGAVGLRNLGNTCFMNSTLQCMSNSPKLTEYFLDDHYLSQINRTNALGWKGRVADEYGAMLKEIWSGKFRTVSPRKFKDVIGQFAPRFSGYQQQDSSELLSFLLDGLHEDLNLIKNKPATNAVESKNREDKVVADEAWSVYQLRNKSVVIDTLQGQLKSRLDCPVCHKISITFDPFQFLSVPLPTVRDKVQEVSVVFADPTKSITVFGVTVSKVGRIHELKKALSEVSGLNTRRMVLADVWTHRVYRFLEDDGGVSEIGTNDHIYCFEVPALDEMKDGTPLQIVHQKLERNPHYDSRSEYSREFNAEAVGVPRVICIPRGQEVSSSRLRELVTSAVRGCVRDADHTAPFKILQMDNGARACLKCSYASRCLGCELPNEEKGFDIGESRHTRCSFAIQWADEGKQYNIEKDTARARDKSANVAPEESKDVIRLGDCIQAFAAKEILSEQDPWYCGDCKTFRQATKKMDLWRLPDLLVVHLKRFSYTRVWRDKINSLVDFPIDGLDMSAWCVNPEEKDRSIYDLYAVSNHMGGMGGGHYTAYGKNFFNQKWFLFDDSRVRPVTDTAEIVSSSAYVLFYARRGLQQQQ